MVFLYLERLKKCRLQNAVIKSKRRNNFPLPHRMGEGRGEGWVHRENFSAFDVPKSMGRAFENPFHGYGIN